MTTLPLKADGPSIGLSRRTLLGYEDNANSKQQGQNVIEYRYIGPFLGGVADLSPARTIGR